MSNHEGGCLCGQVRYTISGEPAATAVCHCTNCQKQSGAAFSVNLGVPAANFSLKGELKTFADKGSSGQPVLRRFCGNCGSPILSEAATVPGMNWVKAGTLDDSSWVKPGMQFWCKTAQAWVPALEGMQSFDANPTG